MSTHPTVVLTANAPQPIGPYSQAIQAGHMLFCSGQIPLDPQSGHLVGAEDVEAQTRQAMKNLVAVLEAGGGTLKNVVKTTIFLKSMNDFPKVNSVYGEFIAQAGGLAPARSTVEVARLPRDVLVEIEAIALI
jgi:2-iminobutanoate/2-iminopropanoate deaminase